MKARFVDPLRLGPELTEIWQSFRQENPVYASPFFAPEFARAVAQARNDAKVAVLESGGDVIGFLPLHLTSGNIGKPIGGHINDYHGPVVAPGRSLTPELLLRATDLAAYDYNHLPKSMVALAQGARRFSFSPRMDLSQGYEACMARKGSSWTKAAREIRRRWRKTEEQFGPIRFAVHDPSDATYAAHTRLKDALYQRLAVNSSMTAGWVGQVLEAIRQSQVPGFAGILSTLHAGDRLIAAHFGMRSHKVWHWWYPSYDLELAKLAPGIALVNECARVAQEQGLTTIDFGRGDEEFKLLFADERLELCEGSMTRQGSMADAIRRITGGVVSLAERLPLGRFQSYPNRAAARFVSGVSLP